ncbi:hypothetical protein Ade02nite_70280 [Paractinoplanes deccanensis]|uniref:DUF2617 family protein n=1 Tax=Paractinoplanes deccanensis TaxID=113561 RepID=A0ABQ3YEH5_9ACTN|nr:DUF2617 family protein [Actinoplanes deccanensis]GID78387.1 hypothetical protein Ade02nite_70280 [Actinoplanes deccanensis]
MIVTIDFARAGSTVDLRLDLGSDPLPALAVLDLDAGVQLRLLETGHQVVISTPDGRIVETVARTPAGHPVGGTVEERIAGRDYRFQGEVTESPRKVRDLRELYAGAWQEKPGTLRAVFPGDPDGIAEIQVELRGAPRSLRWSTTHTFPAAGHVLTTKSSLTVPRP